MLVVCAVEANQFADMTWDEFKAFFLMDPQVMTLCGHTGVYMY